MNPPKCDEFDYIQFLIATQRAYSCTEATRCQPDSANAPAHDSLNRLLHRLEPGTDALWEEAAPLTELLSGVLVLDDSALDKSHAKKIGLVTRHWSGKHHKPVKGINLITLLWSEGESHVPFNFGICERENGGKSKNEHFRDMLRTASGPNSSFSMAGTRVWKT